MLGIEKTTKLIEKEVIEVAPLAYLRGRTLNNSFIIMDESQNTTVEQMKMVLTRIGFGSQAVINGDLTQIDLPKHITSGLDHVINVLKETDGIGITRFSSNDVVRHPLTLPRVLFIHRASGPLAQLVEQLTFNQWVTGSNPVRLTTFTKS